MKLQIHTTTITITVKDSSTINSYFTRQREVRLFLLLFVREFLGPKDEKKL
jgi:hypothetical protein